MLPIVFAVISTVTLDGTIPADHQGDYVIVEFAVPDGTVELQVTHRATSGSNVLDWGIWDPDGFRGWGGGLTEDAVVGEDAASRGYLPGPIEAGTWKLVIGKAKIVDQPASYEVTVTFRDAATLSSRPRAPFEAVVLDEGARWYRGDFHVHSLESGDASATLGEIATLAREQRLDFVAITDHNTVSHHARIAALQPDHDDLLLVRGAEVTTYGGHLNAFGFTDYVDHRIGLDGRTASQMIADIAAQGGALSINHPALDLGDLCIGCAWSHDDTPWAEVHGIEIHTASYEATIGLFTPRAIALWDEREDAGHRLAALGGSDDHRAGMDLGTNGSPIGAPTTLVWADELSEAAILDGVRAGRTVVLLRGPDDPLAELEVEAGGQNGMIGDTVTGARAVVTARVTGGAGHELQLVRNGEPAELVAIDSDDVTHSWTFDTREQGDRYRVEVLESFLPATITSHVYVEYAPGDDTGGCGCTGSGNGAAAGFVVLAIALVARRRRMTR